MHLILTVTAIQFAMFGGEFIMASGIIFGGTAAAASDSMLGRKAIITGLEAECEGLDTERNAAVAARDQAKQELEVAMSTVEEARRSHESAHEKSSRSGVEILSAERAVGDDERKLAHLENERNTLDQQVGQADDRIAELECELQAGKKALESEKGIQAATALARGSRERSE